MSIRSVSSRLFRSLLFAVVMLALPAASFAQIGISITIGPPALPVYEQPPCPTAGYIWTPGFWAYGPDGYYWVPGTWVLAPAVGLLWTPPWWGWGGGVFLFHEGYWGPHVGFYGGIAYGFGYFGHGYEGGRWEGGNFYYNRSVNNVNITNIHNVYNTTVINNTTVNRVSYNGGEGGINTRPTSEEETAEHERHVPPVAAQTEHIQAARSNPQLRASVNQGRPPIAATPRPGAFNERGVVPAKEAGAPYRPEPNRNSAEPRANNEVPRPGNSAEPRGNTAGRPENSVPRPPVHPNELPRAARPAPPNTGNPKVDQKYQKQQETLSAKQDQQRQKLQQRQDQEHQRLAKQKADEARTQQLEQKHQQQTQQLQRKHDQQQQKLQARQQPRNQSKPPEEHR